MKPFEEANPSVAPPPPAFDFELEIGEAAADAGEIVRVWEEERVLLAIEFYEEVEGAVAEVLGERAGVVGGEDGEEVVERHVGGACAADAAVEEEAEVAGALAVVEVRGGEAREGAARVGGCERLPDAVAVGLERVGEHVAVV